MVLGLLVWHTSLQWIRVCTWVSCSWIERGTYFMWKGCQSFLTSARLCDLCEFQIIWSINCLLDTERLARSKLSRTNDEAPPEPTTPGSLAQLLHMLGILWWSIRHPKSHVFSQKPLRTWQGELAHDSSRLCSVMLLLIPRYYNANLQFMISV